LKAIFDIYQDGGHWFIDNRHRVPIQETDIIISAPGALNTTFFTARQAQLATSDEPFAGSRRLTLVSDKVAGGVVYAMKTKTGSSVGAWLSSVFWQFFADAPKQLYVKFAKVS
jgi:hypothetical protein